MNVITKVVTTVGTTDVSTVLMPSGHYETAVFYANGTSTLRPRWSFSRDEAMTTHADHVAELEVSA